MAKVGCAARNALSDVIAFALVAGLPSPPPPVQVKGLTPPAPGEGGDCGTFSSCSRIVARYSRRLARYVAVLPCVDGESEEEGLSPLAGMAKDQDGFPPLPHTGVAAEDSETGDSLPAPLVWVLG